MTMVYAQSYQNVVCGNCRGASGNGSFTRTSYSVGIVCESGTNKGVYSIYLSGGKQYIRFGNSWVCIQGVNSFAYKGNRYYIKRG